MHQIGGHAEVLLGVARGVAGVREMVDNLGLQRQGSTAHT